MSGDSLGKHVSILAPEGISLLQGQKKNDKLFVVASQALGLEPGDGTRYFQEVPMVNIQTNAAPRMQVKSARGNFELKRV